MQTAAERLTGGGGGQKSLKMYGHQAMADRERKRGRRKYKNLNISRTKRAF